MTEKPKPDTAGRGIKPPLSADYTDDISAEQWEAICKATEKYQNTAGSEIIVGEPW